MRARPRRGTAGGFSLVEVLVAFTILVLGLAVLYQAFGQGLRGAGSAAEYARAAMVGRSELARLEAEVGLVEGTLAGRIDTGRETGGRGRIFEWSVEILPYEPGPDEQPLAAVGFEPVVVRMHVSAPGAGGPGRRRGIALSFTTLRFRSAP